MTLALRAPAYFDRHSVEIDSGMVESVEIDFAYCEIPTIVGPLRLDDLRGTVTFRGSRRPVFEALWREASGDHPEAVDLLASDDPLAKAVVTLLTEWLASPEGLRIVDGLWEEAEEKAWEDRFE